MCDARLSSIRTWRSPPKNSFIANIERPGAGYCKRRLCRSGRPPALAEPLVEILADRGHQRLDLAVEEMVGAGNDFLLDDDAFLRLEFFHQVGDVARRHHRVLVAMDDQAGGRAGRQEREIVEVGRRRDRAPKVRSALHAESRLHTLWRHKMQRGSWSGLHTYRNAN